MCETEKNKIWVCFTTHDHAENLGGSKAGHKCFMLYARSLFITWGDHEYWIWNSFKETSDEKIEVAKLRAVCWLDVRGIFKMSDLSPGTVYEVAYVVMLTKGGFGLGNSPIKLRLTLPDGNFQERQISLLQKARGQWMELSFGYFRTEENGETRETGDVCFHLYEHGGHWKNGLVIKGAVLRPIN